MLITTRNSVYKLMQSGDQVVVTKLGDLEEGRHPLIKTGDVFMADRASPVIIGEPLYVGNLETSCVMEVDAEPGDDAICFKPVNFLAEVTAERFSEELQPKLDHEYNRAFDLFIKCGRNLSFDVTNVLLHAADQGKVDEVLDIIEEQYETNLQFQHPNIRGHVENWAGVNLAKETFRKICKEVLRLKPQQE